MNALDPLVDDARERLVARVRKEGLLKVGYDVMDSPLGPLWIAVGPRGVIAIHYGAKPDDREMHRISGAYGPGILPDRQSCDEVLTELDEYFSGRRRSFDVPVDLAPLTPFQRRILAATARVPFGEMTTYREVARRAGNERAARAAGGALGANPIPIVVPCHRVVATDGSLGGYAGGLPAKRRLLALERGTGNVPAGGWPPAHLTR
ncbi:MAG TPA: methylated-DNA--[protein]-cysteine S-methyltransferase [Candidatus Limnocylindria bacterium]|jgi:methylated-DNA-[protein]-cysteine S-methyltransferase